MTTEETELLFENELVKRYSITRTQVFEIDLCKICGSFVSTKGICQHKNLRKKRLLTVVGN